VTFLKITFKPHVKPHTLGPAAFCIVETGYSDFTEACSALARGDLVRGNRIFADRDPADGNLMWIKRREPIAFRGGAVDVVVIPFYRYREVRQ
jgi:hypothetical protein